MATSPACSPASTLRGAAHALVVVLAACPANNDPQTDAGFDPALLPCSTDAECASVRFVCDAVRRTCVCTRDSMCDGSRGGPYCNAFTGRCERTVAGCKGDSDCGEGEFCDPALRACRALKPWCASCSIDEECGRAGNFCIHHPDFPTAPRFCSGPCNTDGSCDNGHCADSERGRLCIPDGGRCNAALGCTPDSGQACAREGDCTRGSDQTCDLGQSRCVAKQQTCRSGQACDPVNRQCVNACLRDAECVERVGPTYVCKNNACVPADLCENDAGCPNSNQWCFRDPANPAAPGRCMPTCNSDSECPLGQLCLNDPATARRRCAAGCRDNGGCPVNAICDDGQCQVSGPGGQRCQVKEACSFRQFCSNQTCVASTNNDCHACAGGCGAGACATLYYNVVCAPNPAPNCGSDPRRTFAYTDACPGTTYACEISRCLYKCPGGVVQCPKGFDCIQTQVVVGGFLDNGPWCWPIDAGLCR